MKTEKNEAGAPIESTKQDDRPAAEQLNHKEGEPVLAPSVPQSSEDQAAGGSHLEVGEDTSRSLSSANHATKKKPSKIRWMSNLPIGCTVILRGNQHIYLGQSSTGRHAMAVYKPSRTTARQARLSASDKRSRREKVAGPGATTAKFVSNGDSLAAWYAKFCLERRTKPTASK